MSEFTKISECTKVSEVDSGISESTKMSGSTKMSESTKMSGADSGISSKANVTNGTSTPTKLLTETFNKNHWPQKYTEINFESQKKREAHLYNEPDGRFIITIVFVLFAIIIIAYKMVIVTMPYANKNNFIEMTSYAQEKYQEALNWANENHLWKRLNPLICGLVVAYFSYMMVYLDSSAPGINPPSPFSSNSKHFYRQQRKISINYMTAIGAGIIVTALMYYGS